VLVSVLVHVRRQLQYDELATVSQLVLDRLRSVNDARLSLHAGELLGNDA
jgi:hypothetical protein